MRKRATGDWTESGGKRKGARRKEEEGAQKGGRSTISKVDDERMGGLRERGSSSELRSRVSNAPRRACMSRCATLGPTPGSSSSCAYVDGASPPNSSTSVRATWRRSDGEN
eukprot:1029910-Pleurochrysis_carterae.AAC.2